MGHIPMKSVMSLGKVLLCLSSSHCIVLETSSVLMSKQMLYGNLYPLSLQWSLLDLSSQIPGKKELYFITLCIVHESECPVYTAGACCE